MSNTTEIWKFEVKNGLISMPKGAKILSIQTQKNYPQMWVWVDPSQPKEDRYFEVFGTGHKMHTTKCTRLYIGTYQVNAGDLVYHLFELI